MTGNENQNQATDRTYETVADVMAGYTAGDLTVDEANEKLKALGGKFKIDPGRNMITPEENAAAVAGNVPEEANGWGYLEHGVGGGPDKVRVENGILVEADMGAARATFLIAGKRYGVDGPKLVEYEGYWDRKLSAQ